MLFGMGLQFGSLFYEEKRGRFSRLGGAAARNTTPGFCPDDTLPAPFPVANIHQPGPLLYATKTRPPAAAPGDWHGARVDGQGFLGCAAGGSGDQELGNDLIGGDIRVVVDADEQELLPADILEDIEGITQRIIFDPNVHRPAIIGFLAAIFDVAAVNLNQVLGNLILGGAIAVAVGD